MANRTDCHRPGAIVPSDYDYLFSYSAPGPQPWSFSVSWKDATALLGTGKLFAETVRNCHSCGAHFRHGDIWRHRPTGKLIAFGHVCADKYGCIADRREYEKMRASAVLAEKKRKKEHQAEERRIKVLTENDGLADALLCDHDIVRDIKGRFDRHGYLSDAQIRLVYKLDSQTKERTARKAEERKDHRDAPEGKQTVTGTIIATKWHDSQFGTTAKMTVKVPYDGGFFLVWSTIPAHIADDVQMLGDLKDETITFTATLSRSDRDGHFAFAKRPSKGRIHKKAEEPAATAV